MTDIRQAFADQADRKEVDLGNRTWQIAADDTLRLRGRWITGDGATIVDGNRHADNDQPALILRGVGARTSGDVTMVGTMPNGHGYDPKREKQHAVRLDGLADGEISGWTFTNWWGDAIYANKGEDHVTWCKRLNIHHVTADELGRHFYTPAAADIHTLTRATIGRVNRSVVDAEPDAASWGCTNFVWSDSDIWGPGLHMYVFASKGVGPNVHHVTLQGIRCHERPFSATVHQVDARPGYRRHDFAFIDCDGAGHAPAPAVELRDLDHARVVRMTQMMAPGNLLVEQHGCTDVAVR